MASATVQDLPVEVLLDICRNLDTESIFSLRRVSRAFNSMIQSNRINILLPILRREFSPFDELLQVYTADEDDINTRSGTYQPRRVVFRRFQGDGGMVLCAGGFASQRHTTADGEFTEVRRGGYTVKPSLPHVQTVVLKDEDLDPLLKYCREVRKWEELFPHLRWIRRPEYTRSLGALEQERLRRALYRWWLYAFYFHGDLERPRSAQPEAFVDDVRTSQMRRYSTIELVELLDLLAAVFHLVQHYICPTLEQDLTRCRDDSPAIDAEVCWNDQTRLGRIMRTYTKLDPKELMHYFEYIYHYPKKRLISDVRFRHPSFLHDQESLQAAIRSVLQERPWLVPLPSPPTDVLGGIVDFGDGRDADRETYGSDASPDGSLPKPASYVRSFSQFSPAGDDGGGSEDWSYPQPRGRDRLALYAVY